MQHRPHASKVLLEREHVVFTIVGSAYMNHDDRHLYVHGHFHSLNFIIPRDVCTYIMLIKLQCHILLPA